MASPGKRERGIILQRVIAWSPAPVEALDRLLYSRARGKGTSMDRLLQSSAPAATLFIRLAAGAVFLTEGIQKFLYPDALGIGRFTKIGIPAPQFFAPFVGVVEIVCGALFLAGLLTRLAAIPLVIDMA